MNKIEFIELLQEELEFEEKLHSETLLTKTEEWDSLGAMLLIGLVSEKFSVTLNASDLEKITTISSLIEKIGVDKFNQQ